MTTYVTIHLQDSGPDEISCEHRLNTARPGGYPVLRLGDVTIFPTRDRLERIRDVCAAYLAAHPEPGDPAATVADERLRSFFAPGEGGAP